MLCTILDADRLRINSDKDYEDKNQGRDSVCGGGYPLSRPL